MAVFRPRQEKFSRIKIEGVWFSKGKPTLVTEDEEVIKKMRANKFVKEIVDVAGETMKLATMTIADLEKEAKRLGVVIEGKITSENKEQVIRKLVEVQGQ